jgi:hypothetical protein
LPKPTATVTSATVALEDPDPPKPLPEHVLARMKARVELMRQSGAWGRMVEATRTRLTPKALKMFTSDELQRMLHQTTMDLAEHFSKTYEADDITGYVFKVLNETHGYVTLETEHKITICCCNFAMEGG